MTARISVVVKTPFGEVTFTGETPEEIVELLQNIGPEFYSRVDKRVSQLFSPNVLNTLRGHVEITREGPVVLSEGVLTQYESIGLIMYCSEGYQCTTSRLRNLLALSGKKVTVAPRLNEMTKKGHVYKPDARKPQYRLSTNGIKWLEEEVLPRLASKPSSD